MYKLPVLIIMIVCLSGLSGIAAAPPAFIPAVSLLLLGDDDGCDLPSDEECSAINDDRIWMQMDDGVLRSFEDANAYCESLDHLGHEDWLIPEQRELECLIDKDDTMPPPYIQSPLFVRSDAAYWARAGLNCRIGVDFVDGSTNNYNNKELYIRCVRKTR